MTHSGEISPASPSQTVAQSLLELPRWKLALLGAVPVAAVGLGFWYFSRTSKSSVDSQASNAEKGEANDSGKDKPLTPFEVAQASKNKGNKYFKGGMYEQAIQCYTEAISVCPEQHKQELSTFYQNRAAAYEQLKEYRKVIDDCSKALEYNNRYTKALFRRAKACETTSEYMQCLEDITAVCILENFANQQSLMMADRVLKTMGKKKAKEAYQNRAPVEPSEQFIRTYFSAFKNDPIIKRVGLYAESEKHTDETPEKDIINASGDSKAIDQNAAGDSQKIRPYEEAIQNFARKDYDNIVKLCSAEINLSESPLRHEALLMRATFYLLRGEGNKAHEDLDKLISLSGVNQKVRTNALIKRGSLRMQNGQQEESMSDFNIAVSEDSENSDIYHHRGQLSLLIDNVDGAVKDFDKSVELSPGFAIAHVQKCYTEYRLAFMQQSPMMLQGAMKSFEEALKKFPDCSEGYALHGQALCDQQRYEEADKNFKKALSLEPDNGNFYVHRGLLQLQWKQNLEEASRLINKALDVDKKCEFAFETLGTIEVQRGNLDRAVDLFNQAIKLVRTEIELGHLFSLQDAAVAQARVAKNFGISVPMGGLGPL